MSNLGSHYLDEVFRSLRGHKRLADTAIAQLNDEQFFALPDPESNSVALIMKHMAGNLRSRFTDFLTTDGEKPDRRRDREFTMHADAKRDEVMIAWEQNWQLLFETINSLRPEDLERTITIRGEAALCAAGPQPRRRALLLPHGANRFPGETLEGRRLEDAERAQRRERDFQRAHAGEAPEDEGHLARRIISPGKAAAGKFFDLRLNTSVDSLRTATTRPPLYPAHSTGFW